jgi:hypothetical protein
MEIPMHKATIELAIDDNESIIQTLRRYKFDLDAIRLDAVREFVERAEKRYAHSGPDFRSAIQSELRAMEED